MKIIALMLAVLVSPIASGAEFKWLGSVTEQGKESKTHEITTPEAGKLLDLEGFFCLITAIDLVKGEITRESRYLACGSKEGYTTGAQISCSKSSNGFLGGEVTAQKLVVSGKGKTWLVGLGCFAK